MLSKVQSDSCEGLGGSLEKLSSAYTDRQPYVFVCYAYEDSDVVYPGMTWLRDQG